jgi:hypothetical protein
MRFKKAVKGRKFNKAQNEGLAKSLDNIATTFIIGSMYGQIDSKFSATVALVLCTISLCLGYFSFQLRNDTGDTNVK